MHPTGGSLRVFGPFAWLGVGSVKMALPRPAHPRVTQAVGGLNCGTENLFIKQSRFFESVEFVKGKIVFSGDDLPNYSTLLDCV